MNLNLKRKAKSWIKEILQEGNICFLRARGTSHVFTTQRPYLSQNFKYCSWGGHEDMTWVPNSHYVLRTANFAGLNSNWCEGRSQTISVNNSKPLSLWLVTYSQCFLWPTASCWDSDPMVCSTVAIFQIIYVSFPSTPPEIRYSLAWLYMISCCLSVSVSSRCNRLWRFFICPRRPSISAVRHFSVSLRSCSSFVFLKWASRNCIASASLSCRH